MPEGMKEKEMIDLLLKRFIKDYDKTKNPEVRTRYGVFAGIVGIICNLILFLAKILAGVLTASVSIMADAVNNLSDAGSSIVTLIGFKLAGKPADYEHPYGHGRPLDHRCDAIEPAADHDHDIQPNELATSSVPTGLHVLRLHGEPVLVWAV